MLKHTLWKRLFSLWITAPLLWITRQVIPIFHNLEFSTGEGFPSYPQAVDNSVRFATESENFSETQDKIAMYEEELHL